MNERDRVEGFLKKHPHHHQTFFSRPYVSRRQFFAAGGTAAAGALGLSLPSTALGAQAPQVWWLARS